jgi:hypothetical protein
MDVVLVEQRPFGACMEGWEGSSAVAEFNVCGERRGLKAAALINLIRLVQQGGRALLGCSGQQSLQTAIVCCMLYL